MLYLPQYSLDMLFIRGATWKNRFNTEGFLGGRWGGSNVIGVYVAGLENNGLDFYQYPPLWMLVERIVIIKDNSSMTKYTNFQSFLLSQTREISYFVIVYK